MDKLSIFEKSNQTSIVTEEGNSLDNVVQELKDIGRELLVQRKADEAFVYGQEVEDNDEVDLDDVEPEEDGE